MIFDHADRNVREEKSHREVRESRFFAQRLLDRDGRERESEEIAKGESPGKGNRGRGHWHSIRGGALIKSRVLIF